jgi:hypothetical protein
VNEEDEDEDVSIFVVVEGEDDTAPSMLILTSLLASSPRVLAFIISFSSLLTSLASSALAADDDGEGTVSATSSGIFVPTATRAESLPTATETKSPGSNSIAYASPSL